MSFQTVLPIWNALRHSLQKKVIELEEAHIHLLLDDTTVIDLLYHTAEVEFMFADWFFNVAYEGNIKKPSTKAECIELLEESNDHLINAMKQLSDEEWYSKRQSRIGSSTPLEAVGRLMNHAGIHAGQISYIVKYGK